MDARNLSDNTKRTICRFAFLLCAFIPSCFVIYTIMHPKTPSHWQQTIKANLGIETKIGSVQTPLPFHTILNDVEIKDTELGQAIELHSIQLVAGPINEITIDKPVELSGRQLLNVVNRLRDNLLRTHDTDKSWKITVQNAAIVRQGPGPIETLEVSPLEITVLPYPTVTTTKVEFQVAGDQSGNSISFSLDRINDAKDQISEVLRLSTGQTYLPCWVLEEFVDDLKWFGPTCQFAGYATMNRTVDGWSGNMQGYFHELDFGTLLHTCDRQITGTCELSIENCTFKNGKLTDILGQVQCFDGELDWPTIVAANQFFGINYLGERQNETIPFEYMEFQFELTEGLFSIRPTHIENQGLIAKSQQSPLLQVTNSYPNPIDSLQGFLSGNSGSLVDPYTIGVLKRIERPPVRVAETDSDEGISNHY